MADVPQKRAARPRRNHALQLVGVVLLALVVGEGLAGSALMVQNPFSAGTLALHITLAVVTVGFTFWAFRLALRLRGWRPEAAALLALLSAVGATAAGATFLLGGKAPAALHWMEGFTVGITVASVLLMVWGAAVKRRAREPAP